ncbi:hypothetical protein MMC10_007700 [Thelotrema lepadinum]|nr:hypothetical protein [Thelotrema lepadinum]
MAGYLHRGLKSILQKHPQDIVILSSLRTPLTRAKKGGLKDAYPEELLCTVLRATLAANPSLPPSKISDVSVGTVLQELGGAKAGRMAANHAGLPTTAAFYTVNRQCASSLAAVTSIAQSIATGQIEVGVAAGMESMSRNYGSRAIPITLWPELKDEGKAGKDTRDCVMPMGLTAENVASRYGVSRGEQDKFAAASHAKAAKARREGWFREEIVPVRTRVVDEEGGEREVEVSEDDGIREGVSVEKLGGLKPAFKEGGTATAGNSSQVTDGAAVALLMRRSTATELGLASSIIGKWAGTQVAGCAPDEMGIGPALAVPKLMDYTGINKEDVGIWELNEAFASQSLYCIRELGIDEEKVNPKGGAIALGHPLGATGARMLATLLPELKRQGKEVGVLSMCMSTGMGMASLIIRE